MLNRWYQGGELAWPSVYIVKIPDNLTNNAKLTQYLLRC